jgi:hypothetical protein
MEPIATQSTNAENNAISVRSPTKKPGTSEPPVLRLMISPIIESNAITEIDRMITARPHMNWRKSILTCPWIDTTTN